MMAVATRERYRPLSDRELTQRVTFQRASNSRESNYGGINQSWIAIDIGDSTGGVRWASVTPTGSTEPIVADKPQGVAEYEVRVRFDSLTSVVLAKDRIVWRSKTLEILGPVQNVSSRREQIMFLAREVTS